MSGLVEIVARMARAVAELTLVLQAEHQQLSALDVSGSVLQRITEQKTSLLATLNYLEQQRQAQATPGDPQATRQWQALAGPLRALRDLNQHNGWLLEGQLSRNQQALEMLRPWLENGLYGADGYTTSVARAGKKFPV